MKVNLKQFLSSLCVQTLSFSTIQFLLNRLVALSREKFFTDYVTGSFSRLSVGGTGSVFVELHYGTYLSIQGG